VAKVRKGNMDFIELTEDGEEKTGPDCDWDALVDFLWQRLCKFPPEEWEAKCGEVYQRGIADALYFQRAQRLGHMSGSPLETLAQIAFDMKALFNRVGDCLELAKEPAMRDWKAERDKQK